jgi:hypothetical protein
MTTSPLRTKDVWAGALYVAFGVVALWVARDYRFGTASRMGAGYFPVVLGGLLAAIGVVSMLRSFVRPGAALEAFTLKPLLFVVVGTLAFALLVGGAGFPLALAATVLIGAMASQQFRLGVKPLAGLVLFVAVCALVFVRLLGLPLPLVGHWFAG